MKRAIMTVVTADWYQYYIPIFVWSVKNVYKDVDIYINLRGELNQDVNEAMDIVGYNKSEILTSYATDYPYLIGTTNALRFTTESYRWYDELLVTDIDFMFFETPVNLFNWHKSHRNELMPNNYYSGHHGPWKKPHRPEICDRWEGDFQRIAGGFVMFYKDWWDYSSLIRDRYRKLLKEGEWGHYRESDEVMLYRMASDLHLPIAPKIPFPRILRQLHLGDFRPNMKVRYEDKSKMLRLLDRRIVNSFLRAKTDKTFSKILNIVCRNAQIRGVIDTATKYCNGEL